MRLPCNHQRRRSKWRITTRKSAHSGHSNSDSFHFLRLRNAAHASLVCSCASASLSSASSSLWSSSSSFMKSLRLDSSASSSYCFLASSFSSSSYKWFKQLFPTIPNSCIGYLQYSVAASIIRGLTCSAMWSSVDGLVRLDCARKRVPSWDSSRVCRR